MPLPIEDAHRPRRQRRTPPRFNPSPQQKKRPRAATQPTLQPNSQSDSLEAMTNNMGYVSKCKTQIVALKPGLQPLRRELDAHNRSLAQLAARQLHRIRGPNRQRDTSKWIWRSHPQGNHRQHMCSTAHGARPAKPNARRANWGAHSTPASAKCQNNLHIRGLFPSGLSQMLSCDTCHI